MSSAMALVVSAAGKAPLVPPVPADKKMATGESRAQLERAKLIIYELQPASDGTTAKVGTKLAEITFQFNPKELTIQKAAKWERKPATGAEKAGPPQFTGAEPCKMTLEMFLDATATHDSSVVTTVETLFACCTPTEKSSGKEKPSPPLVALHWGEVTSFAAFITSVNAKYTLFSSTGTPIRALCQVALEEMPVAKWRQNPTSGGRSVRRAHQLVDGDSLASVAYAEYGDPTMWRPLAAFNGIDDPLRVRSGTRLLLPTPAELGVS
ncbi:peptidase M23 [Ornithinimicrobium sp. F0845]|uniref:CIS tube protein n=1 Tax=Ornithinimicrobium sp. F0845 TaxID=2926412 RepID=UPI001FF46363|nr:peptidase M23 [Ornithinimicrobium sp. F0845]MCK0113060.1 peptidase M23 [Ornithinimicrobium sp. F0845]